MPTTALVNTLESTSPPFTRHKKIRKIDPATDTV